MKQFWLMRCTDASCSIVAISTQLDGIYRWQGVRDLEGRDRILTMCHGDSVLFCQAGPDNQGVAGVVEVCREAYPDPSAFDARGPYFDAGESRNNPMWFSIDLRVKVQFIRLLSYDYLRGVAELEAFVSVLFSCDSSVVRVERSEFEQVCRSGGRLSDAKG